MSATQTLNPALCESIARAAIDEYEAKEELARYELIGAHALSLRAVRRRVSTAQQTLQSLIQQARSTQ